MAAELKRATDEIAHQIRSAAGGIAPSARFRIVGGGTTAIPPQHGELTIHTTRCRGVVAMSAADLVVTVGGGTPLCDVNAALAEIGCRLPLRPWMPALDGEGCRGTIGGALAAAADGLAAREGFRWRDSLLGATVILGDGSVIEAGARVVKSVAGFDVPKLLVGSRGTLGVIACATIRIERIPDCIVALRSGPHDPLHVAASVAVLVAGGLSPRGVVVTASDHGRRAAIDVLFEGSSAAVAAARTAAARAVPVWIAVDDPAAHWGRLTERASRPPPSGLHRRVAEAAGAGVSRMLFAHHADGVVVDLLRGRATWWDQAPAPPAVAEVARLADRVRRAFDPDSRFAPGRGWGAP